MKRALFILLFAAGSASDGSFDTAASQSTVDEFLDKHLRGSAAKRRRAVR